MKNYTAQCACKKISIKVQGEPNRVLACHCSYCKRATGTAFRSVAWFKNNNVISIEGKTKIFDSSERSKGIKFNFCPNCGTTIYWTFTHTDKFTAIALGCFEEQFLPKPSFEFYTSKRVHWLDQIKDIEQFEKWPPQEYFL